MMTPPFKSFHIALLLLLVTFCASSAAGQSKLKKHQKSEQPIALPQLSQPSFTYHLQHYFEQPLKDTLRIANDFDFPVMVARIESTGKNHVAEAIDPNYFKPGKDVLLILTAPPRQMIQPYEFEYRITVFSVTNPDFSHTIEVHVKADINS